MSKRKDSRSIGKRVRFEVFKRDKFTCQYCGSKAPEVVLHVDHIAPVVDGGSADILNLVTACAGCNLGKGRVPLSDTSAVEAQRAQLEELQERREQIELMLQWRESLAEHAHDAVNAATRLWEQYAQGWTVSANGKKVFARHIKKYGLALVLEAISESADQYLEFNEQGDATESSEGTAWAKIGAICFIRKEGETRPNLRQAAYIGGIANRRFGGGHTAQIRTLAEQCLDAGATFESIRSMATSCSRCAIIDRLQSFLDEEVST